VLAQGLLFFLEPREVEVH